MQRRLDGRRILVTGGSSGIGEAVARECVREGAQVAALARRADRLKDLASEIGCVPVVADVTDEASARQGVESCAASLGGIDVVINNAGVSLYESFSSGRAVNWRTMLEVNLLGTLYVTHAALPYLRASEAADIVNVSSATTHKPPTAINGVYTASKSAVRTVSESLRIELRDDDIRVTVVSPGAVATDIALGITDDAVRESLAQHLAEVGLQPGDVARQITHLLTEPRRVSFKEILVIPRGYE